jgi:PTH2 family peptidyl-tRNA hydrolase
MLIEISIYSLLLWILSAVIGGYYLGVSSTTRSWKPIKKIIAEKGLPNDDDDDDDDEVPTGLIRDNYGVLDAPYKMVLCVNMGLKMEKGKIAAQCSHATLGAFKMASQHSVSAVRWWQRTGQAKIAVKIENDLRMEELASLARKAGLVTYIVMDAGRTQIAAGSKTVLAIGPAPVKIIDKFTSSLKLL